MERLTERKPRHSAGWRGLGRVLGLRDYFRVERNGAIGIGGKVLDLDLHRYKRPEHVGHTVEYLEAKGAADAAHSRYVHESGLLRDWLEGTGPDDRVIARLVPSDTDTQSGSPQVLAIQLGRYTPDTSWQEQSAVRLCVTTDLPLGDDGVHTDADGALFNTFYLLRLAGKEPSADTEGLALLINPGLGQWDIDREYTSAATAGAHYATSRAATLRDVRALIEQSVPYDISTALE